MDEAEKIVETVEKISEEHVNPSTIIAVLILAVVLLWAFYTKVWPHIRKALEDNVQKRLEEENEHQKLENVEKGLEAHDAQLEDVAVMMRGVAKSVDEISKQLSGIAGENKLTLSVLLDMIECMQDKTSPEECAKRAQASINKYYREGQVPPNIIN